MMNLSNSTATISTYSGGTEDHSPSSLHVGVVFGIVIIGIVLIVTLLLLLCKAIKSTYPQMHTNWTADIFRHHTNQGRRKSRSVVNHSTKQKHQMCTSSRPDFQLVVREQKLCGPHSHNPRNENQSSFALLKSADPDDQYKSSLQEKPPPAYSEVIQSSAYPSHFTSQQTINGTLTNTCKPACSDYPPPTPQLDENQYSFQHRI